MSDVMHTPGPWELRVNGVFLRVVTGEHKNTVADGIVSEANAILIAQSPVMLVVLKEFVRNYDDANPMRMADMHFQACQCIRCTRDRAADVIAKATKP